MIELKYPKKTGRKKKSKVQIWNEARQELKLEYEVRGITSCEIGLKGCWRTNGLSFAHRYKRADKRCEHTFEGTLLLCVECHRKIEYDKWLTEYYFNLLR